ncbi:sulfatase [Haloferula helveola]|uniref:Sulfatase n=1 Tax=Haloferula helveola TaxID=490095 RepID=A0ABM7RIV8_9BACT|nr:sulfatase [Haloferula helveola]
MKPSCPGNPLERYSSRREFFYVGLLGGLGMTLPGFLKQQARGAQKFYETVEGPAKGIIHIFLPGGMAHQESFDPKPFAPAEYRGPFGAIDTSLPGIQFGQKIPRLAKLADKMTVIRSMSHGEAAHERGTHNMFTGYRPSPALEYPSIGSVISHELGSKNNLPPYVCVPNVPNEFANSGYLSSAYGPFALGSDPAQKNFQVRDLNLPGDVSEERFARRKSLLETVDSHFRELEKSDALDSMDAFYQHAYKLISSEKAREAFNLEAEDAKMKERYGNTQAGQRMLLARRLIEAGTRFVSLTAGGWDHHNNIKNGIEQNLPPVDQAVSALITDLDERGMLDETLVVVTSEFGRTPKINPTGGRDHWPRVFSVMLAGGGVKRGYVHGSSDALGGEVDTDGVTVADLATTLYKQIGITADKELMAPGNRPIEIVDGGKVLESILA